MAVESIQKRLLARLPSLSTSLLRDTFDGEEIAMMNTIMRLNLKRYGYAL